MKIKIIRYLVWASCASALSLVGALLMPSSASATSGTYYYWTGADSGTNGSNGCTTNCWSVAGNWDVATTQAGPFSTAATNAPSSSDNGGAGDNLIFDTNGLSASKTLTDDISNLTVDTITSENTGAINSYSYSLVGQAFSLTNGELAPASGTQQGLSIANNVTIAASQNYGASGSYFYINFVGTLTVPSNVTLTAESPINIETLAGAGNVVFTGLTGNDSSPNNYYIIDSSTESGNLTIDNGAVLQLSSPAGLGTASVTIESGGQLYFFIQGTGTSGSLTVPNTITMAGNGAGASFESQGAIDAYYDDSTTNYEADPLTITFSGAVTLTGNTTLASEYASNVTYNFTGGLNKGSYTLTAVAPSQPTYGTTTIEVNGTVPTVKAPGTPDTGIGLSSDHSVMALFGAALIASALVLPVIIFRKKSAAKS